MSRPTAKRSAAHNTRAAVAFIAVVALGGLGAWLDGDQHHDGRDPGLFPQPAPSAPMYTVPSRVGDTG